MHILGILSTSHAIFVLRQKVQGRILDTQYYLLVPLGSSKISHMTHTMQESKAHGEHLRFFNSCSIIGNFKVVDIKYSIFSV